MADIYVATPVTSTTINAAITSASAGDTIIIPDGTYHNIGDINFNKSGSTSGNETTLRAATPGNVTFTGTIYIGITEDYLIVQDFSFDTAWSSYQNMIQFYNCNYSRITNCSFVDVGTDAYTYPYLIRIRGGASTYNRIDHCLFEHIEAIAIQTSLSGGYTHHTQIDYNHFKNFTNEDSGATVNFPIQFLHGSIADAAYDEYCIVEYNLFDNCRGDTQTIANKSSNNIYRYNTFKNGKALVLRGGDDCTVESNYFYGNNDIGIRFFGTGHIIKNNYFESLLTYAIYAPGGDANYADTYNCSIINNTLVNLGSSGGAGILLGSKSTPPHDLTFKNNIVTSNQGTLVKYITTYGDPTDITYTTCLHYATGTAVYGETDPGIAQANPSLTQGTYIQRLQSISTNAIEEGTVDSNVTDDIDGHTRDGSVPDIGCDEYSIADPARTPVTESDVGPSWTFEGWTRKCALAIQANKVNANQVNFPVLLTEDTLPSEMFDADGSHPALSGGGDIRFSSDSAGDTRLSCEVVTFTTDNDPANGVAEIWVKVPSISSSSNTTIYVWYNKSGESQPAADAAYGSESVWDSNFKLIQHMNEDPSGGAPQMIDSTSSDGDGTSNGIMTSGDLVAAQIGKGLAFDGSNDYIDHGSVAGLGTNTDKTISVWVNLSVATSTYDRVIIKNKQNDDLGFMIAYVYTTNKMDVAFNDGVEMDKGFGSIVIDTWYHLAATYDESAGTVICYKDGVVQSDDGDGNWNFDPNDNLEIGARSDVVTFFNGIIDEVHISTGIRTLDWIKTEYNNQNDPSTFVIEGTPEGGMETIDHLMIMGM